HSKTPFQIYDVQDSAAALVPPEPPASLGPHAVGAVQHHRHHGFFPIGGPAHESDLGPFKGDQFVHDHRPASPIPDLLCDGVAHGPRVLAADSAEFFVHPIQIEQPLDGQSIAAPHDRLHTV